MRIRQRTPQASLGFSLTEAVVALAVGGIMILSFYTGINSASHSMRLAREDLRATQVMLEKIEAIRLCNWDQVNDNTFLPATFTAPVYPELGPESPVMTGALTIEKSKLPANYKDAVLQVTVSVQWSENGHLQRSRRMTTYVSRYGITKYLSQKS